MQTKKQKILIFIAIFTLLCFSFAKVSLASQISPEKVFELINKARIKEGLKPLTVNQQLSNAAFQKAQDMAKNSYFAHISPAGKTPWNWIDDSGYNYQYAGENLAMDYKTAEEQQKAWMDSLTHKKNILNPNYTETGIATSSGLIDGQMANITVEEFGSPINAIKVENGIAPIKTVEKKIEKPAAVVAGQQKDNLFAANSSVKISLPKTAISNMVSEGFLNKVAKNVSNEKTLILVVLVLLAIYIFGLVFSAFAGLGKHVGNSKKYTV